MLLTVSPSAGGASLPRILPPRPLRKRDCQSLVRLGWLLANKFFKLVPSGLEHACVRLFTFGKRVVASCRPRPRAAPAPTYYPSPLPCPTETEPRLPPSRQPVAVRISLVAGPVIELESGRWPWSFRQLTQNVSESLNSQNIKEGNQYVAAGETKVWGEATTPGNPREMGWEMV